MKYLMISTCLALTLGACGKGASGEGTKTENGEHAAAPGGGPSLDCDAFNTKMKECIDPFAAAYAKTELGIKAGTRADGTKDEGLAADRFKMLWKMQGESLCTDQYAKMAPEWRQRFVACDATAACDAWAPCMATATGTMLE